MSAERNKILVVDDDAIFRTRLLRALASRGLEPYEARDAQTALEQARAVRPGRAIVDLRMPGKSGIDLIPDLIAIDPEMQILVLTGYGSIATAVEAVRRGAIDYLSKPVDTEQILAVFDRDAKEAGDPPAPAAGAALNEPPPSLARVEWEHIQRVLSDCGGNISEAARRLGIHRRSLQRKLAKLPPL
jgi:two-component system response regulator RegA